MTTVETAVRVGAKVAAIPLGAVSRRRAGDVVVLCYHRVGVGEREIDVPAARFVEQLEVVAQHGPVAQLDDIARNPSGGVILTFDDGFRDFYDIVLPLLVSHEIPATLYLATGFVDAGSPSDGIGPDGALTWSMIEEAVSTGLVTIGSHTHGHVDLSRASEQQADDEMRRSKHLIEDRLGQVCAHFAYPWGKSSPIAERVAAGLFTTAALDAWRTNRKGRIEPLRLGRTPVFRSDGGFFFKAKTRGQLDGERLAYRALRRGPWTPS